MVRMRALLGSILAAAFLALIAPINVAKAATDTPSTIFEQAVEAEREGNYRHAAELYRQGMNQDCMRCYLAFSYLQEHGYGVPRDYAGAVATLHAAADKNYTPAIGQLAAIYLEGWHDVEADSEKAVIMAIVAIFRGDAHAMLTFAKAFTYGIVASQDPCEAKKWYGRALRRGLTQAQEMFNRLHCSPAVKNGLKITKGNLYVDPLKPVHGFTEEFADIYYRPQSDSAQIVPQLIEKAHGLHLIYTFEIVRRLARTDPGQAYVWRNLAMMRLRYAAARCRDASARGSASLYPLAFASSELSRYVKTQTPEQLAQAIREGVTRFQQLPVDTAPSWLCGTGMRRIIDAMSGKTPTQDALTDRNTWADAKQRIVDAYLELAKNPQILADKINTLN